MIANYHTHSYHCRHALGMPEDYVKAAIGNGLRKLGFSDHVPYPFSNGHKSGFRMDVEETGVYVNEILELREKYKGQIEIFIGYEAEYYPREFDAMLKNISRFPYDYLICGQHFSDNEYDGRYNGSPTDDPALLHAYVDTLSAAMSAGVFSYVAHPDMFNYTGPEDVYREETLRLCEASVKYGVPLEYNCLGMEGKRHYPSGRFWKIVSGTGAEAVIGSDAHEPVWTGNKKTYDRALAALRSYGIEPVTDVVLKQHK